MNETNSYTLKFQASPIYLYFLFYDLAGDVIAPVSCVTSEYKETRLA